jgi:hypothetical protein
MLYSCGICSDINFLSVLCFGIYWFSQCNISLRLLHVFISSSVLCAGPNSCWLSRMCCAYADLGSLHPQYFKIHQTIHAYLVTLWPAAGRASKSWRTKQLPRYISIHCNKIKHIAYIRNERKRDTLQLQHKNLKYITKQDPPKQRTQDLLILGYASTTPWIRVLPEKLKRPKLLRNSPYIMELEGFLPHLQESATCPYPEPDWSSPCPPTQPLEDPFHLLSSHLRLGLPSGLLPSGFPTKALYAPQSIRVHKTGITIARSVCMGIDRDLGICLLQYICQYKTRQAMYA